MTLLSGLGIVAGAFCIVRAVLAVVVVLRLWRKGVKLDSAVFELAAFAACAAIILLLLPPPETERALFAAAFLLVLVGVAWVADPLFKRAAR